MRLSPATTQAINEAFTTLESLTEANLSLGRKIETALALEKKERLTIQHARFEVAHAVARGFREAFPVSGLASLASGCVLAFVVGARLAVNASADERARDKCQIFLDRIDYAKRVMDDEREARVSALLSR